jgi:hypothetical protein
METFGNLAQALEISNSKSGNSKHFQNEIMDF